MKHLLLTIFVINFLSSCQSTPDQPREFKGGQLEITISGEPVIINGEAYYPANKIVCRTRQYMVSEMYLGALDNWKIEPNITPCKLMIGYRPKVYTELINLMEFTRQEILNAPACQ